MKSFFQKLFIIIVCLLCCSSCSMAKVISNPNEYGTFMNNNCLHEYEWIIFPENLDNTKTVNDYKYLYDTILMGGHQIYLDVIYDEDKFQKEIEKLNNFEYSDNVVTKSKFRYDRECKLFNYPTYIAIYMKGCFSYASILREENKIIYVYIESGDEDLLIPEEYLPKEYHRVNSREYDSYHFNFAAH